jgi:very-short-patch-repair endonuclease
VHDLVLVPERWITTLHGIRVVRPELAMYQLAGDLSLERAERTYDKFAVHRLLTGQSSRACLEDIEQRGRDGTVNYRYIIKVRGDDYVAPASGLESRFKELGQEVGLNFRRQVSLGGEHWDARVDFYEDRAKVVFEVQSELYHWALSDREADARRRAKLEDDGFAVYEVWDTDVWARPRDVTRKMWNAVRCSNSPS